MKEALDGRFSELFERYVRRVYSFFFYRVEDGIVAEDLTSQTFFKAYGAFFRFTEKSPAQTTGWVFMIAANTLKNWYRHQTNNKTYSFESMPAVSLNKHMLIADQLPLPEEALIQEQEREKLFGALETLPALYQDVLVMKYASGLSNMEISLALGKTELAIKSLSHRAIVSLRERMKSNNP